MKKIAVIGVYGVGEDFTTGQAVKCHELIEWMQNKYGSNEIYIVNTYKWKKNPIRLLLNVHKAFMECKNILMLPAQNGIGIFAPLIYYLNKLYNRSVHYIVIGGWLQDVLCKNDRLKKYISSMDGVYVETNEMVEKLSNMNMKNIVYMPNFRKINKTYTGKKISEEKLLRVCTYSRVVEEKGILDAIKIVEKANKIEDKMNFILDIYGKIDEAFEGEFKKTIEKNKKWVTYRGIKSSDEGVETVRNYFALLFPTYYEGEGIAGTLLDALVSGTPSIVNEWKYNAEVIDHGVNGYIYPFRDIDNAALYLIELAKSEVKYLSMSSEAIKKSEKFSTDAIMNEFIKFLRC